MGEAQPGTDCSRLSSLQEDAWWPGPAGSRSAAGSPPTFPLDVVMQPEAGLAGGLGAALFQLPVGQG